MGIGYIFTFLHFRLPLSGPLTKQTVNKSVSIYLIQDDLSKWSHLSYCGSPKGCSSVGTTIFGSFVYFPSFIFPIIFIKGQALGRAIIMQQETSQIDVLFRWLNSQPTHYACY